MGKNVGLCLFIDIQFKLTFLSVINIKVLVLKITVINYYYYFGNSKRIDYILFTFV